MPDPAADAGNATGRTTPALKPHGGRLTTAAGKSQAREDALREYQDFNAKRRSHIPAPQTEVPGGVATVPETAGF